MNDNPNHPTKRIVSRDAGILSCLQPYFAQLGPRLAVDLAVCASGPDDLLGGEVVLVLSNGSGLLAGVAAQPINQSLDEVNAQLKAIDADVARLLAGGPAPSIGPRLIDPIECAPRVQAVEANVEQLMAANPAPTPVVPPQLVPAAPTGVDDPASSSIIQPLHVPAPAKIDPTPAEDHRAQPTIMTLTDFSGSEGQTYVAIRQSQPDWPKRRNIACFPAGVLFEVGSDTVEVSELPTNVIDRDRGAAIVDDARVFRGFTVRDDGWLIAENGRGVWLCVAPTSEGATALRKFASTPFAAQPTRLPPPPGATCRCRDGSYMFVDNCTCSRHGGVAEFYNLHNRQGPPRRSKGKRRRR